MEEEESEGPCASEVSEVTLNEVTLRPSSRCQIIILPKPKVLKLSSFTILTLSSEFVFSLNGQFLYVME